MTPIFELLKSRELFANSTQETLAPGFHKIYHGIDPTADCLHLGNLVGLIVLRWFQKLGHTPILILGGATGMIGDPSGRSHERQLLDEATLKHNVSSLQVLIRKLLPSQGGLPEPVFLNNYDWFHSMGFLGFLRDVGKHFRLSSMLAKESVQSRLHSPEGISFTEFCYQTLQAYDFYHLFETQGVTLQCGGNDQWGNITAGCDLISRLSSRAEKAVGLVYPLLTKADGTKFGKSQEGAVWLSSDKLSPYKFYQHALASSDSDVIGFMKRLTFMPLEEIATYERALKNEGSMPPGSAQKRYAEELTRFIHGEESLTLALQVTEAARPGTVATFDTAQLEAMAGQIPTVELESVKVIGCRLVDLFVLTQLVLSKADVRRLIDNRGAYLNGEPIEESLRVVTKEDLLNFTWLVLSAGKKKRLLVKVLDVKDENGKPSAPKEGSVSGGSYVNQD